MTEVLLGVLVVGVLAIALARRPAEPVTWFANPNRTGRFHLSPGTWIELRTELGALEVSALDETADPARRMRMLIVAWNLQEDGAPAPIDDDHLRRIYLDAFEPLDAWLASNVRVTALPKVSSGRSRSGLRAAASRLSRMIPRTH